MLMHKNFLFILALAVSLLLAGGSYAHLMVEQKGTLNIVGSNAYMVISVPTAVFSSTDSNQDGQGDMIEFNKGREIITQQIEQNLVLEHDGKNLPLHGLRLIPDSEHYSELQLVVMGKYELPEDYHPLYFKINLFGKTPKSQSIEIQASDKVKQYSQSFTFTPDHNQMAVY